MTEALHVLVVEDSPDDVSLMTKELERAGFEIDVVVVSNADEYRRALDAPVDVVLSDYSLPGFGAREALRVLREERQSDLPFLIVTGSVGEEEAVAGMRAGADDYLLKDRLTRLGEAVRHAVSAHRARAQSRSFEERLRRKEIELLHAQKLEAVGRLAGGVAHDFNNLLTAMMGAVELLKGSPALTAADCEALEEIEGASQRAAMLTRQLLDFSRQRPIDAADLDLNEVVADLQYLVTRLAGPRVRVETTLDPEAGPVHADRGQIEQVLMNLAANARDAMPEGGTIEVETAAEGSAAEAGAMVRLTVRDSGTGIDAETQRRIFDPFFTTKPAGEGTGLGLSTVRDIVSRAGGTIEVESTPGAGTAFHLRFPRVGAPQIVRPPAGPTAPHRSLAVVLDQDAAVRQVVCRLLEHAGVRAVEARDPGEVIAALQNHVVDLLVAELSVAGVDGRSLATDLARERPSLGVVLISGDHAPDDEEKRRLGGLRIVQKPFSAREFMQAALEVIAERRGTLEGDR